MRTSAFFTTLVCALGFIASCQKAQSPEPLVLKYTGVKADMEEVINARLAAVTDAAGKPLYRFSHTDARTGAKWGSKFRRMNIHLPHQKGTLEAEVEFRPIPFPQYKGADDIFTLAFSTETGHSTPAVHLFFVDLYWFQTFSPSWLMPFEGPEWAPSNFKYDFIEACCLKTPSGPKKLYAIPFSAKGNLLFYRKDVLALFGLSPPETWDSLRYAVQTIREVVESPKYLETLQAVLLKYAPELKANPIRLEQEMEKWKARLGELRYGLLMHSVGFHNDFYPIVWGYGGDIFTDDPVKQKRAAEALRDIKAMFYDDMAHRIRLAPSPTVFQGPFAESSFEPFMLFAEGQAIFMINWDNRLDRMIRYERRAVKTDNIGICPIPHREDCVSASNIGSWGWVVNAHAINSGDTTRDTLIKKAAEQFIYDLTSKEAQEWLAEHFGYVPSREIRLSEPVLAQLERTNPSVLDLFRFFRTKGKVNFINRPGSKRQNDLLEQALHEAIAKPPNPDPVAELNYLSNLLDEVRTKAKYF